MADFSDIERLLPSEQAIGDLGNGDVTAVIDDVTWISAASARHTSAAEPDDTSSKPCLSSVIDPGYNSQSNGIVTGEQTTRGDTSKSPVYRHATESGEAVSRCNDATPSGNRDDLRRLRQPLISGGDSGIGDLLVTPDTHISTYPANVDPPPTHNGVVGGHHGSLNVTADDVMRHAEAHMSSVSQWDVDSDVTASGRSFLSDSYSIDSATMRPRRKARDVEPTHDSLLSSVQSGSVALSIDVYARRWYVLAVFSLFGFMQGGLVDVYAVIAESAEVAFNWTDAQTSLMQYWIYICYVIAIFPSCWLTDKKGCCDAIKQLMYIALSQCFLGLASR